MKPAPPGNIVGFDVQPQHVYYASYMLRNAQYDFAGQATKLVEGLDGHEHAVGCGTGPEAFAKAYADTAVLFLEVWNRTTEGVGGAAVGLTVTANNYLRADHTLHPLTPVLATKNPPDVLKSARASGPVAELGWGNAQGEDGWGNAIIDEVSGAVAAVGAEILRPILSHALRHGKVADITPGGDDSALPEIAKAWRQAAKEAKTSAEAFDDAIAYITNPATGHDEWQSAMKQFCSAMWGTSDWGKEHHGYKWAHKEGKQPALDVLQDTARDVATACDGVSAEVTKIRSTIVDVYKDAATKTFAVKSFKDLLELIGELPALAAEFITNIDTGRLNSAVDSYNREIHGLGDGLTKLKPALEEAKRSVPTYSAEEARAEAFGARSLNDFKGQPLYTVAGEEKDNHFYTVDLANQEGVHGSHVIDKHVGQSDAQLVNRLRDQPGITAASTFTDLATAQKATQSAMDEIGPSNTPANAGKPNTGVNNPEKIEKWLSRPRSDSSKLELDPVEFDYVTGRTIPSGSTTAHETHSVKVILKYKNGIDPPYVVLTSMPK
ncbi:RNase A-like domain-containing protein [Streptomyces sp. P3]|uniref:RNase A-like domain-containing protein n=1 Tax=Streptomyces sp. P3 TaxID=2135430 RepID=UPI0020B1588E|nr:RNase A-like domain-containing protein [Streptomyces sp. P3]